MSCQARAALNLCVVSAVPHAAGLLVGCCAVAEGLWPPLQLRPRPCAVQGLPQGTTEIGLRSVFAPFGTILDCRVLYPHGAPLLPLLAASCFAGGVCSYASQCPDHAAASVGRVPPSGADAARAAAGARVAALLTAIPCGAGPAPSALVRFRAVEEAQYAVSVMNGALQLRPRLGLLLPSGCTVVTPFL